MIWKDRKTTFFIYAPYECAAVEEYLEQMAEKGWLLQGVKGPLFKFKRIVPQKIKYSVDALNKISIFDHKDPEVALEYREYCKTAGWTYICQTGKIQIFYADDYEKITPIHTDDSEKFKTVFKSSLYEVINQLCIVIIFIFNIYTQLFWGNADFLLSSNFMIMSIVAMFSLVFVNIIKSISFFLWVIKARKNLKENKFTPYNDYKQLRIKNILLKIYMVVLLLILFSFLVLDEYISKSVPIAVFIIVFVFIIFIIYVQIFINKKKYSKITNMIIIISSSIASIFLLLILIVSTVIWSNPHIQQNEFPNEQSTLTLMDFGYKEGNDEDNYTDFNKSVLAKSEDYSFGNKNNYLSYTLFQSKYPWVVGFHKNRLLNRITKHNTDLIKEDSNLPRNIKVYSYKNKKFFILVSDDNVVKITKSFSNIRDDEFLNIVYNKLFND